MGDWASGLVICVTGFDKERRRLIKHLVEAGCGEYRGSLNRECTHLVVCEGSDCTTSKKLSAAKQNEAKWKTQLTSLEWVLSHGSLRGGLAENESSLANCRVRKDRQPAFSSTNHMSPSRKRLRLSRFASGDHDSQGADRHLPRCGPLETHPLGNPPPSDPTGGDVDAAPKSFLQSGCEGSGIPRGSEGVSQTRNSQQTGQSSGTGYKQPPPSLMPRPYQDNASGRCPLGASTPAQPSHHQGSMPFPPLSWVTKDVQPSIGATQVPHLSASNPQTHPEQGHVPWQCGGTELDPPRFMKQAHAVPSVTQHPNDCYKPAKAAWQCGVGRVGVPGATVQPLGHGPSADNPQVNYLQGCAGGGGVLHAVPQVSVPVAPKAKAQAGLPAQTTVRAGTAELVMEGPLLQAVSSVSALQFKREDQRPTSMLFQREEGRPGIAMTQEKAMALAPPTSGLPGRCPPPFCPSDGAERRPVSPGFQARLALASFGNHGGEGRQLQQRSGPAYETGHLQGDGSKRLDTTQTQFSCAAASPVGGIGLGFPGVQKRMAVASADTQKAASPQTQDTNKAGQGVMGGRRPGSPHQEGKKQLDLGGPSFAVGRNRPASPGFWQRLASAGAHNTIRSGMWGTSAAQSGAAGWLAQGCEGLASEHNIQGMKFPGDAEAKPWIAAATCVQGGLTTTGANSLGAEGRLSSLCSALKKSNAAAPACRGARMSVETIPPQPFIKQTAAEVLGSHVTKCRPENATTSADELSRQLMLLNHRSLDSSKTCEPLTSRPAIQEALGAKSGLPMGETTAPLGLPSASNPPSWASTLNPHPPPLGQLPLKAHPSYAEPVIPHLQSLAGSAQGSHPPPEVAPPLCAHQPKGDLSAILSRLEDIKNAGRTTTDVALLQKTRIAPPGGCAGSNDRLGEPHHGEGKVSGPAAGDCNAAVLASAGSLGVSEAPGGMTGSGEENHVSSMPAKRLPRAIPSPSHTGTEVMPSPGKDLLLQCELVADHPAITADGNEPTCSRSPGTETLPTKKLAMWLGGEDPSKRRSSAGDPGPPCSSTLEARNICGLPSSNAPHGSCTPDLQVQTAAVHNSLHVLSTASQAPMHMPSTAVQVDAHEGCMAVPETTPDFAARTHQRAEQCLPSKVTLHKSPTATVFFNTVQRNETSGTSLAFKTSCNMSRAGDVSVACPHGASSCGSRKSVESPRGDDSFTLLTSAAAFQDKGKPGDVPNSLGIPTVSPRLTRIPENASPGRPPSSQVLQRTASERGESRHPLTTPMLSPDPLAAAAVPQIHSGVNEKTGGQQPVTPLSAIVSCKFGGDDVTPTGQCKIGGEGEQHAVTPPSVIISCERPGVDITPLDQCINGGNREPQHGTLLSVTVSCELPEGAEEATPGMSCASVTQARWRVHPGEARWKGGPVPSTGEGESDDAERRWRGNSLHPARDGGRKDGEKMCKGVIGAPGKEAKREEPVAGPTSIAMSGGIAHVSHFAACDPASDPPSQQRGVEESDEGQNPPSTPTPLPKPEETSGAHGTDDACASQLSQCKSGKLLVTPQALHKDDSLAQSAEPARVHNGKLSLGLLMTPASTPHNSRMVGVAEEASLIPPCILGCAEGGEQDNVRGLNQSTVQSSPGETGVARSSSPTSLLRVTGDMDRYRANLGCAGPLQACGSGGEAVPDCAPSLPTPTPPNTAPGGSHLLGDATPRVPGEQGEQRAEYGQRHELGLAHTPRRLSQLSGVNTGAADCYLEPLTAGALARSGAAGNIRTSGQTRGLGNGKCFESEVQPSSASAAEGAAGLLPQTDILHQPGLVTMHGREPVQCPPREGQSMGAKLSVLEDEHSLGTSTTSCMGERTEDVDLPGGTLRGPHWAGTSRGCTGVLDLVESLNRSMCGRPATTPHDVTPAAHDSASLVRPHVADTRVGEAPSTTQDPRTQAGHEQTPRKPALRGRSNSKRPARSPTPASLLNDILWAVDQPITAALLIRPDQEEGRGIERDCTADEKCWGGEPLQAGDWDLVVYPGVSLTIVFPGGGKSQQEEVISRTYQASTSGLTRHQLVKYIWDFYQEPVVGWDGQQNGTPGNSSDVGLPRSALLYNRTCLQGLFRMSRDRTATTYSLRLGI